MHGNIKTIPYVASCYFVQATLYTDTCTSVQKTPTLIREDVQENDCVTNINIFVLWIEPLKSWRSNAQSWDQSTKFLIIQLKLANKTQKRPWNANLPADSQ